MQVLKRYLGIVWMIAGPVIFISLVTIAFKYITSDEKGDISNPVPWLIILIIFAPIAIGFAIFGWYCWKDEY